MKVTAIIIVFIFSTIQPTWGEAKEVIVKEVNQEFLEELGSCEFGKEWFAKQTETDPVKLIKMLIDQKHYDPALWSIHKIMPTERAGIGLAIYVSETSVLQNTWVYEYFVDIEEFIPSLTEVPDVVREYFWGDKEDQIVRMKEIKTELNKFRAIVDIQGYEKSIQGITSRDVLKINEKDLEDAYFTMTKLIEAMDELSSGLIVYDESKEHGDKELRVKADKHFIETLFAGSSILTNQGVEMVLDWGYGELVKYEEGL